VKEGKTNQIRNVTQTSLVVRDRHYISPAHCRQPTMREYRRQLGADLIP